MMVILIRSLLCYRPVGLYFIEALQNLYPGWAECCGGRREGGRRVETSTRQWRHWGKDTVEDRAAAAEWHTRGATVARMWYKTIRLYGAAGAWR